MDLLQVEFIRDPLVLLQKTIIASGKNKPVGKKVFLRNSGVINRHNLSIENRVTSNEKRVPRDE